MGMGRREVNVGFGEKARVEYPSPLTPSASRRMRATPTTGTKPELLLRSLLHRMGLRFRVNLRPVSRLSRRADIVFARAQLAVFVDGCFWHGCPDHATWPKNNSEFWRLKIEGTRRRDEDTKRQLELEGWKVLRYWEHDSMERAAHEIRAVLASIRE